MDRQNSYSDSAVGLYTYRTIINLTNLDPKSVVILGQWSTDNAGRDIQVMESRPEIHRTAALAVYTPFAIYGTNTVFLAGTNASTSSWKTLTRSIHRLRMEILQTDVDQRGLPYGSYTANHREMAMPSDLLDRNGRSQNSSPRPTFGSLDRSANRYHPYHTAAAGAAMFFRVVQPTVISLN